MLVLTRKAGEALRIGTDTQVRVLEVCGDQVRIGIEAPTHKVALREEVWLRMPRQNREAAGLAGSEEGADS